MVKVAVPATTANLGPGFDSLGLALRLYNTLEMVPADGWQLDVSGEGVGELPGGSRNLVWRAACCLWQHVGCQAPVVKLHMHNEIPLGRGLGSSAAAIVGGLVLANEWAGCPLDSEGLLNLATELEGHPDNVAPALLGGLVVSSLSGSNVASVRLDFPGNLQMVICVPAFKLPTQRARAALPKSVPFADAAFNVSRVSLLLAALIQGRYDLLPLACEDRLHQPYRASLIPGFSEVVHAAGAVGALACMISGAGPTLLALVPAQVDPHFVGQTMVHAFARNGIVARALTLEADTCGARVLSQPQG